MGRPRVPRIQGRTVAVTVAVLALLWAARLHSYPLFHTIAEMFSITVAISTFMVMWNSRRFIEDDYLLLIGTSFLFIACVDTLHLLTYRGMGLFPGISDDPPTQFWIIGRALQAGVFLVAPSFIHRRPAIRSWLVWLGLITTLLVGMVALGIFPSCLGPDGLTAFKVFSEFVIIAALLGAWMRLRGRRTMFEQDTYLLVSAALIVSAVSEAAFTAYRDPFGPMNLVGHFLRLVAFALLYRATVVKTLTEPYAVLFRQLAEGAEAQAQTEKQLRRAKRFSDAITVVDAQINATFEFEEIMRRALVESAQAMGADSAAIMMRESSSWVVRHAYRLPGELLGADASEPLGQLLGAVTESGGSMVVEDATSSELVDPTFAKRYRIRTLVGVPLRQSGATIGAITFHKSHTGDGFTPEALDFTARLTVALALATDNAHLYAAQKDVADTLQKPMLSLPTLLPGAVLAHAYRSADEIALIGGDFYDALQLDDERIAFFVGDVSGKGIDAAAASSMVRTTLRAFVYLGTGPAGVLEKANDVLYNTFVDGRYATVTLCVLNVRSGELVIGSAGHPDPYLCRADGCMRHVAERDMPIGLFPDTEYTESRVTLEPGQTILLYSDGLLDTRRGKEFFGEARVHEIIEATSGLTPAEIISALTTATEEFSGSQYTDDIALMAVRYSPES